MWPPLLRLQCRSLSNMASWRLGNKVRPRRGVHVRGFAPDWRSQAQGLLFHGGGNAVSGASPFFF